MTGRSRTCATAGLALAAGLALLAGCTKKADPNIFRDPAVPANGFRLVSFNSCDDALARLRQAAKEYVGPFGFGGAVADLSAGGARRDAQEAAPAAGAPAPAAPGGDTANKAAPGATGAEPNYSGTNTHEAGVDEPDLVKTDGKRILVINAGVLRVVDAASREVTGRLDLGTEAQDPIRWSESDMLLHGDTALVLVRGYGRGMVVDDRAPGGIAPGMPQSPIRPEEIVGPRLLMVDLAGGRPRLAGSYTIDGDLVDARQVGAIARVVIRSAPRVYFPFEQKATNPQRLAANRAIIDRADADDWLPRYEVTAGGKTTAGRVDCAQVSRPVTYSGTSMVTVLTYDLNRAELGSGDPVTVVADGDTVYSNGPSLYVANDQRWRAVPVDGGGRVKVDERTEIYKFDTARPGRPRYAASGAVPGWLLNQYSMSEWNGHLRVATTSTVPAGGTAARSESAVYVLRQRGEVLTETGKVGGLGKGERIYAVRFTGTTGYVVTFRQTDPLYTVDLRNPSAPRVTGELKITGYSAYLHPVGDTRLIGIGQEASTQGRTQGTQVSLFDVSDLAKPSRLTQHHVRYGHSEAEFDPHAFLYWPDKKLLVVPLNVYASRSGPEGGALVLRVGDGGFTELGMITHPATVESQVATKFPGQIRRSLIIDDVLWTVSTAGLKASSADTLAALAWIPF